MTQIFFVLSDIESPNGKVLDVFGFFFLQVSDTQIEVDDQNS